MYSTHGSSGSRFKHTKLKAVMDFISHWIGLFAHFIIDFLVNAAVWWANWLLQFGLFVLNVAVYVVFLWPWIVLMRGLILFQKNGVDAMLDYYASYVDKATSIMAKLIPKKGVA